MKYLLLLIALIMGFKSLCGRTTIDITTRGSGNHFIIIAGFGGEDAWESTVDELAIKNTCHLISVKGVNGTNQRGGLEIGNVIADIMDYISSHEIEGPILMGHSFGGFISMQLVFQEPQIFSKLILVDSYPFPSALINPSISEKVGSQQAKLITSQLMKMPEHAYLNFWKQNFGDMDCKAKESILESISKSSRNCIVSAQGQMLSSDLRTSMQVVTCPMLVLVTAQNFLKNGLNVSQVKTLVNEQFSRASNPKILIHESASHFLMLDDPAWFINQIYQFI